MNFGNTSEISLSDSISGYVTCGEDDEGDNTHYLSVLSEDITLEGMNVTLSNAQENGDDETLEGNADDVGQPIFFTIDGTDEIYGIQIARDEEGNLQKYQAQYTENTEGQLVPMFETVQVLPLEDDVQNEAQRESHDDEQIIDSQTLHDMVSPDLKNSITNIYGEAFQRVITTKRGSSEAHQVTSANEENINLFHDNHESSIVSATNGLKTNNQISSLNESISDALDNIKVEEGIVGIETCNGIEGNNIAVVEENIDQHFEQLYVEEIDRSSNENDADNQVYQIVETSENEPCFEESIQTILKETIEHQIKTNILKKLPPKSILKDQTGVPQNCYYVQTIPEKENVEFLDGRQVKPNSRSLLICNQPGQALKKKIQDPSCVRENKNSKRCSRTKEAKEARQFINFINATTIPQVPERKERLPRKQQIKPVQHPNEDIVVKEMIVSSNSFIEPISAEEKKNLPVTEYVELLDSGDECSNEEQNKKEKRSKEPPIEIEISDSEESNLSIIELDSTTTEKRPENNDILETNKGSKQKRTRADVNRSPTNDKIDTESSSESPPKICRTETDVEAVTSTFEIISMANDGDSMQNISGIRPLEDESLKNTESCPEMNKPEDCIVEEICVPPTKSGKQNTKIPQQESKLMGNKKLVQSKDAQHKKEFEYKYECEKCRSRFINRFLLNRHNCNGKSGLAFSCNSCSKKFPNSTSLNVHSKIHFKQPSLPNANPKIQKPEIPKTNPRIPTRASTIGPRPSVGAPQSSLRTATQKDASKTGAIPKRSLKPPAVPSDQTTPSRNVGAIKLGKQCEKCPMRFDTHSAWFDHQVLVHDLKTPDKTIGEKRKKSAIKIVAHSGVLANSEVAKNFSILRNKVRAQQDN